MVLNYFVYKDGGENNKFEHMSPIGITKRTVQGCKPIRTKPKNPKGGKRKKSIIKRPLPVAYERGAFYDSKNRPVVYTVERNGEVFCKIRPRNPKIASVVITYSCVNEMIYELGVSRAIRGRSVMAEQARQRERRARRGNE